MPNPTHLVLRLLCAALLAQFSAKTALAQSPGTLDTSFVAGASANGGFSALVLQANGQVIVGGSFTTFRAAGRNCIARVNADGSLDTFSPGLAFSGYNGTAPTVQALAIQSDGKILAAGSFTVLSQSGGGGLCASTPMAASIPRSTSARAWSTTVLPSGWRTRSPCCLAARSSWAARSSPLTG